jgi:hypothetical protein
VSSAHGAFHNCDRPDDAADDCLLSSTSPSLGVRRERQEGPTPRDPEDRLFQALPEENHRVDLAANEAYERRRATDRDTLGRVLKGNSKPYLPPELPDGTINLSDPDSRVIRSRAPRPSRPTTRRQR